jgi:hypothetical protein
MTVVSPKTETINAKYDRLHTEYTHILLAEMYPYDATTSMTVIQPSNMATTTAFLTVELKSKYSPDNAFENEAALIVEVVAVAVITSMWLVMIRCP